MKKKYILRGRLVDGISDEAIEKGLVAVSDGIIQYAGPESGCKEVSNIGEIGEYELIDAENGTILPGFFDCHAHICGDFSPSGNSYDISNYEKLLNAAGSLNDLLDSGFTCVRDMSLFSPYLKKAAENGTVRGPRIIAGSRVISPTSGHSDINPAYSVEYFNAVDTMGRLMDGVEGCLRGVREEFRRGAEFIKICATGGVSSITDNLDDMQFSFEEIKTIVEEAARHNTYVTAHCSGLAGTLQALKAGVECVEHGDVLNGECLEIMLAKGIPAITTLYVGVLCTKLDDYPEFMKEKASFTLARQINSLMTAHKTGVKLALGTDFSNSRNTPYAANGLEFQAIVDAGWTPMEAIKMATSNAAYACRKADILGTLEAGKLADIVICEGNPLTDISAITHKDRIKLVMLDGELKKQSQI